MLALKISAFDSLSNDVLSNKKGYDCNRNWTHNYLFCKQTLDHLAKMAVV